MPSLQKDQYLTDKTGVLHFKLKFDNFGRDFISEELDLSQLHVDYFDGIVFTEVDSSSFDLIKKLSGFGFKLVAPSMTWITRSSPILGDTKFCKIVYLDSQPEMLDVLKVISRDFDSSHYAQYSKYIDVIPQMYADKVAHEYRNSNAAVIYYNSLSEPVAFTTIADSDGKGYLCTSCVKKSARNSRAYFEMISRGTSFLINERGLDTVSLECLSYNIVVQKVWAKLGYLPKHSTVVMQKGL
jgi:hypothetical protein